VNNEQFYCLLPSVNNIEQGVIMFIYTDSLSRNTDISLSDNTKKQIIFTTPSNEKLFHYLKEELNLPHQFFEDVEEEDQSISYDEYENVSHSVAKYMKFDEDEYLLYEELNVSLINVPNKLIILCDDTDIITEVAKKFSKRYRSHQSIEYATYTVLDILVDNSMLMIDVIDSTLEKLEDDILNEMIKEHEIQRNVYFARRTLNRLSKISVQGSDAVNKMYNNLTPKAKKSLKYEFIDLKEHLKFLINESRGLLDRTGYLLNLHMGMMSNKMNQAMQRLAAISLIFLPLTFLVGNYGMNFEHMPELKTEYGYFYITAINLAIALGIYIWLKRKKWI
jgi:magnesium transporter